MHPFAADACGGQVAPRIARAGRAADAAVDRNERAARGEHQLLRRRRRSAPGVPVQPAAAGAGRVAERGRAALGALAGRVGPGAAGRHVSQLRGFPRRHRRAAVGRLGFGRAVPAAGGRDPGPGRPDQHPARSRRPRSAVRVEHHLFRRGDRARRPGHGPAGAAVPGEPSADAGLARDSRRLLFQPLRGRQRRGRRRTVRASPPHQSPQVPARRAESGAGAAGKPGGPRAGRLSPAARDAAPAARLSPGRRAVDPAGRPAVAGRRAAGEPGPAAADPGVGERQRPAAELGDAGRCRVPSGPGVDRRAAVAGGDACRTRSSTQTAMAWNLREAEEETDRWPISINTG